MRRDLRPAYSKMKQNLLHDRSRTDHDDHQATMKNSMKTTDRTIEPEEDITALMPSYRTSDKLK